MATWVTHFRIAEEFIRNHLPVSKLDFLVGNIGPDCGLIGNDGKPMPPKEITHFMIDGNINAESFYNQYLLDINRFSTPKESYYLGYYFHLVTDEEWIRITDRKNTEEIFKDIINTPEYTPLVKREWYGLDFLYLARNKESIFWTDFQYIDEYEDYLSFFPVGHTSKQIKNITEFYVNNTFPEDHEFIYFTSAEMDEFVNNTVRLLKETINQRLNLNF